MRFAVRNTFGWVYTFIFISIVWTIYRYGFTVPEWADEFIAKPLLQSIPVLLVVVWFERKPVSSLFGSIEKPILQIAYGLGLGVVLVGESVFVRKALPTSVTIHTQSFLSALIISLGTGINEEIVFRGYFTSRIRDSISNLHVALGIQSVLFALIHVPIIMFSLEYSPSAAAVYLIQIGILGYIYGIVYNETGSIIPTIIAHTMWNTANGMIR